MTHTTPDPENNTNSFSDFRAELNAARAVLRRISSSTRIRNCQRFATGETTKQTVIIKDGQVSQSRFSHMSLCGRLSCPNCGYMRGLEAEQTIDRLITSVHQRGGGAQLLVATSRAAARLDHEQVTETQSKAYSRFIAALTVTQKGRLGIAGVVHMPEVSYTPSGINPHSNVLVVYNTKPDERTMQYVTSMFTKIWISAHVDNGLPRPTTTRGVVSQEVYNPSAVSGYLTKSYKHGVPRSTYNNKWFTDNGELRDKEDGKTDSISNPHDILRMIAADPKLSNYFISLRKGQSIVRLGGLDFGVVRQESGAIIELEKLPKIVRHWLDYETVTKGRQIISMTKTVRNPRRPNEIFWQAVLDDVREGEPEQAEKEGGIALTIEYDKKKWMEARTGIDSLITNLNQLALNANVSSERDLVEYITKHAGEFGVEISSITSSVQQSSDVAVALDATV